ncbi:MAG TPA: ABC transporter permease [Limnochordia bacterium]|nr:ABC transporter permease [Limnochordia bacterium]
MILWQGLSSLGVFDVSMIPAPFSVLAAGARAIRSGELIRHVGISVLRVVRGFLAAAIAGVTLGLALGWVPLLRTLLGPLLHFLRQIPPVAWIPVFIMWFGIGESSKISVVTYAAFFPILLNTETATAQISRNYFELGRAFKFTPFQLLTRIIVPGSLGPVFTGLRLGLSNSWRALVAAEMLASAGGLGYLIVLSRELVQPDVMFLGIAVMGLLGLAVDAGALRLQKRLAPWSFSLRI